MTKSCVKVIKKSIRIIFTLFISLTLATILTYLLWVGKGLDWVTNLLKEQTNNETLSKILSIAIASTSLFLIFFFIVYGYMAIFHNQSKMLDNDKKTHLYLLQFDSVRSIAIVELEKQLSLLYIQEARMKHKNVTSKVLLTEISELEDHIEEIRAMKRQRD